MLFNSYEFLFAFLPILLLGFFFMGRHNRNLAILWLGVASLLFYAWDSPLRHVLLLLASISANFTVGYCLVHPGLSAPRRKALLVVALAANLAAIGYLKYIGFLFDNLGLGPFSVMLPLGISFFTFTQIAFIIDAYRGQAKEYNPIHYLLFVTYFPHLVAGPILHHKEMMPQFRKASIFRPSWRNLSLGLAVFTVGMAKKIFLADAFAPYANVVFDNAASIPLTVAESWLGALAYTLQIYFDFSGYSDMAIGLSLLIGIRLPINFNSPYKAASIIDFWRRWHISLSRFLRDYLYVSLGGNRKGEIRRHVNLMVTMLLGGLWHGAGWTFIVWGGLHGFYLVINHFWAELGRRLPRPIGWGLTFLVVVIAWVFFRAADLGAARVILLAMGGGHGISLSPVLSKVLAPLAIILPLDFNGTFQNNLFSAFDAMEILTVGLLLAAFAPNTQEIFSRYPIALGAVERIGRWRFRGPTAVWAVCLGIGLWITVLMISGDSPFLYFRF